MPHAYTEDQLIEQPAVELFAKLGWHTISAREEIFGRNIQELFEELLIFTRALSEGEQRHVRENLAEEELTVFDILTRPGPDSIAREWWQFKSRKTGEAKKVARQSPILLNKSQKWQNRITWRIHPNHFSFQLSSERRDRGARASTWRILF